MKKITSFVLVALASVIVILSCSGGEDSQEPEANSTVPTLTGIELSDVTNASAAATASVSSDGGSTITARGFCWATTAAPTTTDTRSTASGTTGSFSSAILYLAPSTLYHIRAYATNSVGTAYGTELTFTTLAPPSGLATVSTAAVFIDNAE